MKRALQRLIQDPLALKILEGEFGAGKTALVEADLKKDKMTLERAVAKAGP